MRCSSEELRGAQSVPAGSGTTELSQQAVLWFHFHFRKWVQVRLFNLQHSVCCTAWMYNSEGREAEPRRCFPADYAKTTRILPQAGQQRFNLTKGGHCNIITGLHSIINLSQRKDACQKWDSANVTKSLPAGLAAGNALFFLENRRANSTRSTACSRACLPSERGHKCLFWISDRKSVV